MMTPVRALGFYISCINRSICIKPKKKKIRKLFSKTLSSLLAFREIMTWTETGTEGDSETEIGNTIWTETETDVKRVQATTETIMVEAKRKTGIGGDETWDDSDDCSFTSWFVPIEKDFNLFCVSKPIRYVRITFSDTACNCVFQSQFCKILLDAFPQGTIYITRHTLSFYTQQMWQTCKICTLYQCR